MDLNRTLWRGIAVVLLVSSGLVMAQAAPALAWDADTRSIPCGATHTIPAPFGASFTYDNSAKSAATIYVFTNDKKLPTDGNSLRHFISTTAKGGLTVEVKTNSVVVKAKACPPPPPRTPDPERVYVECNTDPTYEWHPGKGQSAVWTWTASNHTTGKLVIYLNSKKRLEEGQAQVYLFSTHEDCSLKIAKDKNSINVWASKKFQSSSD